VAKYVWNVELLEKKWQYIRIKTKKEKKSTSSQESWNPSMLLTGAVLELILARCPSKFQGAKRKREKEKEKKEVEL